MIYRKEFTGKILKVVLTLSIVVWLLLQAYNFFNTVGFFFVSSHSQITAWYPNTHWLIFIALILYFPLTYATWLLAIVHFRFPDKSWYYWPLLILQSALVIWLQYQYGFYAVSAFALLFTLPLVTGRIINFSRKTIHSAYHFANGKFIGSIFLFIIYIILCALLPRTHPFAKYTMFNHFGKETHMYEVRDINGHLIPLRQYSVFFNDELFAYEEAAIKNYIHGNNDTVSHMPDYLLGAEMCRYFISNLKPGPFPFDSVKLYRVSFTLENNKTVMHEKLLGTYQAK